MVRIEISVQGEELLIVHPASMSVAPVVHTSSSRRICFPCRSHPGRSAKTLFRFLRLSSSERAVWVRCGRRARNALAISIPVALERPLAISSVWLYPRRAFLRKCIGIGTIRSTPDRKSDEDNSFPIISPRYRASWRKRRYFKSCISCERSEPEE